MMTVSRFWASSRCRKPSFLTFSGQVTFNSQAMNTARGGDQFEYDHYGHLPAVGKLAAEVYRMKNQVHLRNAVMLGFPIDAALAQGKQAVVELLESEGFERDPLEIWAAKRWMGETVEGTFDYLLRISDYSSALKYRLELHGRVLNEVLEMVDHSGSEPAELLNERITQHINSTIGDAEESNEPSDSSVSGSENTSSSGSNDESSGESTDSSSGSATDSSDSWESISETDGAEPEVKIEQAEEQRGTQEPEAVLNDPAILAESCAEQGA